MTDPRLHHISGPEVAAYLRAALGTDVPNDMHLSGEEIAEVLQRALPLVSIPAAIYVSQHDIVAAVTKALASQGADGNGGGTGGTPPPPDPVTVVAFGGVNDGATAVDATLWAAKTTGNYYTETTYVQLADDQLRITTPSTTHTYSGYAKIQGKHSQQSGKVSGSFTTQNKGEHRFYVAAFCDADPGNGNQPDGWYLNFLPVSNSVQFSHFSGGTETIIGTAKTVTFASGGNTVHWEIEPGVGASVWLDTAAQPESPTFPATADTTPALPQSAQGTVFMQLNSGGTAEVIQWDHDAVTFDALDGPHPAAPPSDAAISTDLTKPHASSDVKSLTWIKDWEDTFTGTALDTDKWLDHEPSYQSAPGFGDADIYHPIPADGNTVEVADGTLTMKVRKGTGLPKGAVYTGVELNTRDKYATPQLGTGDKLFIECRTSAPSGRALWPALWTEGYNDLHNGTDEHTGWPVLGENDLFEFFNNKGGQFYPFWSLHFPYDMDTDPPGVWLHDTHAYQTTPAQPLLVDSLHTWGLLVEDTTLTMFVDGVQLWQYVAGTTYNDKLVPQEVIDLFRAPQFLRLSASGGGYAGQGWSRPDEWDEGDLVVDYVRVFKHSSGS